MDLVRPATVVPQGRGTVAHVGLGHGDGLAVVQRLDGSEEVHVLLKLDREVDEQLAALLRSDFPPLALEGLAGRSDGNVDILLGGLVDGANDLLGGGVDDLESLAVDTLDELVVDEPAGAAGSARRRTQSCHGDLQAGRLLVLAGVRRVESGGSHGGRGLRKSEAEMGINGKKSARDSG